ncbi:MAG: histidine kinase [Microbacterium sp.]
MRAVIGTSIIVIVAFFAWRPPIAVVALTVVAGIGAVSASSGDYLLASALLLGLVGGTCSVGLSAAYGVVVFAWIVAESLNPRTALQPAGGIVVGILALVSLLIGVIIRQQQERWSGLAQKLEESEREVAEQLKHERDLIADELHDIVAHEITIVALHAAVLERTQDPQTRTQSQTAIREAAVQALTDIRRVLGMVRGEENLSPDRVPSSDNLQGTIDAVVKELGNAGITVVVDLPPDVRIPHTSLLALIRVIRESATNVLKHATGTRHVTIALSVAHDWVHLTFSDDSPPAHTAGLPSSGYGIMRLHERFRLFGGTFDAGRENSGWVVRASLPLTL